RRLRRLVPARTCARPRLWFQYRRRDARRTRGEQFDALRLSICGARRGLLLRARRALRRTCAPDADGDRARRRNERSLSALTRNAVHDPTGARAIRRRQKLFPPCSLEKPMNHLAHAARRQWPKGALLLSLLLCIL